MRATPAVFTAALIAGTMSLSACGGAEDRDVLGDCGTSPNTCNGGPVREAAEVKYGIPAAITNWNLRHAAGTTEAGYAVLTGLMPSAFVLQPDGVTNAMSKDLLASVEQAGDDPQTIVYRVRPEAKWSDGTPIGVADFVYNWQVADGKSCPTCQVATAGYDQIESIKGSDGGKTVTVRFAKPFTDWKMLFSPLLPAHVAATYGSLKSAEGLARGFNEGFVHNVPKWSGGPYRITDVRPNVSVVEQPNPAWYGTAPRTRRLVFRIVTDSAQLPTALSTKELDITAMQAEPDLVEQIDALPGISTHVGTGSTLAQLVLNTRNKGLDTPVRQAILTAVNRAELIRRVLGPSIGGRVKAVDSFLFLPAEQGYGDALAGTGLGSGRADQATARLTAAGYRLEGGRLISPAGKPVPPLRYLYPPDQRTGKLVGTLLATWLKPLGIEVTPIAGGEFATHLGEGGFDILYISRGVPGFPFFGASVFWTSRGVANFGGLSDPKVDRLVQQASSSGDRAKAAPLLAEADRLLAADAPGLPLYAVPTYTAIRSVHANVRPTSTRFLTYNVEQWGTRADAG
ncbi:ABC transporter family substrate-binding protein [Actinomadura viridis]|uniref:ABC transporter family substrate-binding protein n=1 Tax=Actinomadura viridis TaxID=58110 RepID=UPI003689F3F5